MGIFDRLTGKNKSIQPRPKEIVIEVEKSPIQKEAIAAPKKSAKKRAAKKVAKKKPYIGSQGPLSEKERATMANEPYVNVISFELDKENQLYGNFELDWNDIFIARLVKAGFQGKTDADIVDNWFKMVCSGIVADLYAQEQADPETRSRVQRKKLSDGRTEVS